MGYSTLSWQIDKRVLTLTLNRPEQLNAFTTTMAEELIDAYNRASADDAVGAVVVTGAGRAFCAGMDLSVGGNVFGLDETANLTVPELDARWDDPAFPAAFGWFDTPRYWQDMILALREQVALMDESPLVRQF